MVWSWCSTIPRSKEHLLIDSNSNIDLRGFLKSKIWKVLTRTHTLCTYCHWNINSCLISRPSHHIFSWKTNSEFSQIICIFLNVFHQNNLHKLRNSLKFVKYSFFFVNNFRLLWSLLPTLHDMWQCQSLGPKWLPNGVRMFSTMYINLLT